jgi:hypothetical protein
MAAALNAFKTSNFKNYSMGVGKSVPMSPLNFYAIVWTGYPVTALATKDVFLSVRFFILDFILNKAVQHFIALFIRRHPKKMGRIDINGLHCLPFSVIRQIGALRIILFNLSYFRIDFNTG